MKTLAYATWVIALVFVVAAALSGNLSNGPSTSVVPSFRDTSSEESFLAVVRISHLPPMGRTDEELVGLGNSWCHALGQGMTSEGVIARINEGSDDQADAILQGVVVSSAVRTLCPDQASKWP